MTRTAATTTEQNVVERQLAIESSLATTRAATNNCNQLLLARKSQTLLHFCPVITSIGALSLSLSLTLSLWVCVRVSGKLSVQWQQKELTAKQNRQRKRERKRVSKAAASNRCTSRK